MEESFKIKPAENRLETIIGLRVIMNFNSYNIEREGRKISHIRHNGEGWEQMEGILSNEEVAQIGDAIESKYM